MPRKNSYITATDQFCGAGGSTTGAKLAGVEVKMALNHWNLAIETHNQNHPDTDHDCTDVQACDPRRYPSTDILIASPECTNHSLAKGKKRKGQGQRSFFDAPPSAEEERSRATMWDVPRFAEYHDYNIIIVENVVDARRWRMWDAWLMAMHSLGYEHQSCFLNSMFFHPCPQSRDRLYVVFWKKGNRAPDLEFRPTAFCDHCGKDVESYQWWKNSQKKWGKYGERNQYLYRCSECTKIVEPYYYAAFNIIDWTIPGQRIGDRKKPLAKKTMARIRHGLEKYGAKPLIITNGYSSGIDCRVKTMDTAFPTQTGDLKNTCLMHPYFINHEHGRDDQNKSAFDAFHTQTTAQATGFVTPFFVDNQYDGKQRGPVKPFFTQTARQTTAVITPFVVELNRTGLARKVSEHLSTILANGNHHLLVSNYSPGYCRPVSGPGGTITASDSHGVLETPIIVENYGQSKARPADAPLGAVTTRTNHGILSSEKLNSFLSYYYGGSDTHSHVLEQIGTVTTKERAALITQNGININDCLYRMLRWHEIRAAMSFPDDYVILGTTKQKVKQLGNAVTPPVMEWLVDRCVKSLEK